MGPKQTYNAFTHTVEVNLPVVKSGRSVSLVTDVLVGCGWIGGIDLEETRS